MDAPYTVTLDVPNSSPAFLNRTSTVNVTLSGAAATVTSFQAEDSGWYCEFPNGVSGSCWHLAAFTDPTSIALTGHTTTVNAVAISPDGTWIATGSSDGTVRIWDRATATQTAVLTGHITTVNAVAISPDGTWIATGSRDNTVRIWSAISWLPVAMMRTDGSPASCSWSPDGKNIAVGGAGGLYCFRFHPGP
ncbi:WD40 repeat domain-containing protein [Streptomyces sp. NPDC057235]|uniref:WD40 repeat domain-containing protein n=1 Tax=Streptomyces sp. NPDC057235 TaxID=3346058 RepID=UPI003644C560